MDHLRVVHFFGIAKGWVRAYKEILHFIPDLAPLFAFAQEMMMKLNCLKLDVNGVPVLMMGDDTYPDIKALVNALNELYRLKPDAVPEIDTDDGNVVPLTYDTVVAFTMGESLNTFKGVTVHKLIKHISHRWAAMPLTFDRDWHGDYVLPDEPASSHIMRSQSPAYEGEMRE